MSNERNSISPTPSNAQKRSKFLQQSKLSYAMAASNSKTQSHDYSHSDYEIVVEFQLRREREKTRILEERLHNKEVFIQQMKEYQDQLTVAFEKCQEELVIAKKSLEQTHCVQRQYLEEIADLKHLIIRLEDQITMRDNLQNRRHYSSVKEHPEQKRNQSPVKKQRQQRSKTLMNHQEQSPMRLKDKLEQQMIKDSKKITKFIRQFLMMAQCFLGEMEGGSLKEKLKVAWKWIKDVVKEWNQFGKERQIWENFMKEAREKIRLPQELSSDEALKKIVKILKGGSK